MNEVIAWFNSTYACNRTEIYLFKVELCHGSFDFSADSNIFYCSWDLIVYM